MLLQYSDHDPVKLPFNSFSYSIHLYKTNYNVTGNLERGMKSVKYAQNFRQIETTSKQINNLIINIHVLMNQSECGMDVNNLLNKWLTLSVFSANLNQVTSLCKYKAFVKNL